MIEEELKKEWKIEFENKFGSVYATGWGGEKCPCNSAVKSFISSLLAKQQEMTNSEWVAYGKKMGYHDYWKDMTRIALQEEVVKIVEKLKENWEPAYGYDCEEEKGWQKGIKAQIALKNKQIDDVLADIKSKLNI